MESTKEDLEPDGNLAQEDRVDRDKVYDVEYWECLHGGVFELGLDSLPIDPEEEVEHTYQGLFNQEYAP